MNQKTTKRAITALVAVLTLALVSAACNNGGSPTSPATNLQASAAGAETCFTDCCNWYC